MKRLFLLLFSSSISLLAAQESACLSGDCENGKGFYKYENGDSYEGDFKQGMRHGWGTYYFVSGNIYKGQHDKDRRHGYGTYKWTTGDTYIGEYFNNKRHGVGTFYFNNGTIEEGYWQYGRFEGDKLPAAVAAEVRAKHGAQAAKKLQSHQALQQKAQSTLQQSVQTYTPKISPQDGPRHALIIGNAQYTHKPLRNPVRDAQALAQKLQQAGFTVQLYTNLNQAAMKQAIRTFGATLHASGGVGLFYYAGHGVQLNGHNYLLPIEAHIEKSQDIDFEAVDLGRVLAEMDYAENSTNILILDACRDNPFAKKFGGATASSRGLAPISTAPSGTFIAFSTAPGAVAFDGNGAHGLYTQALLEVLPTPSLKLEDVFKRVRTQVRQASEGQQIPWENSSLEADFYFHK